jgi:hypothetical protein
MLVGDLFGGGNRDEMLRRVADMAGAGAQVIALLGAVGQRRARL